MTYEHRICGEISFATLIGNDVRPYLFALWETAVIEDGRQMPLKLARLRFMPCGKRWLGSGVIGLTRSDASDMAIFQQQPSKQ